MESKLAPLTLKPATACQHDLLALGEVMLRLDPGENRIRSARQFTAWEGGGEYNVARGLSRCFGLRTSICTALAENEVGRLLESLILQGGVDTRQILWRPYDGLGRAVRNGLNFTERGFGLRGALGMSDRGHTAASQLKPGDVDWDSLMAGTRWFHTGGIFAALSDTTLALVLEAIQAAKRHGVAISYDLNYRPSLWQNYGGLARAREVNAEIVRQIDVLIGNAGQLRACLGNLPEDLIAKEPPPMDVVAAQETIQAVTAAFPQLKAIGATLRATKTATRNDWGAAGWVHGSFFASRPYWDLDIFDRIGGGDGFASGFIYGLLNNREPQYAIDCGAAHGALAMTTPGDNSMATLKEIEALMQGNGAQGSR